MKAMKKQRGYVLISGASILWGTMGILGKLAFEFGINPTTLIALRLLVSSLTISIPVALSRNLLKIQKKDLLPFLTLGVLATAFQRLAYFYSIDLTTVTVAAILFYTYPILVTIFSLIFFKEKISPLRIFSIVLAFLGVMLVVRTYDITQLSSSLLGVIAGLLSSIFFVLFFFIIRRLRTSYSTWTLVFYGDGIGALALFPLTLISLSEILNYPLQLWFLILAIAWGPSLLAYLMYSHALKNVESAKGSTLGVLEPLSAALFSLIILGEAFELLQIAGIALTLTGVALLFYSRT
ncbi:MAG: DMT family transporter [Candidatus Bathyarchaeota archaeon]|nr:MAG: DMT family transporter [Candidatus Bathyarchaeota archaeon]